MALRATAPEFVPFSIQHDSRSHHVKEEQRKPLRRRRKGQRKQGTAPTAKLQQHQQHERETPNNNRQHKNQSRRRRRRLRNSKRQDESEGISEALFPPLIPSTANDAEKSKEASNPTTRDWLSVAERAHELEEEEFRKEAIRLSKQSTSETVKLTPLGRSAETTDTTDASQTVVAELDPGDNTETDNKYHRPQHYVNTNMDKLRNRWWDLIKQKNLRDYEKRQRELEEENSSCCSSESTEEWEESLVETRVLLHEEPKQPAVDPVVLEACLESSYPLHRAVMEDDEKAVQLLLVQDDESWTDSFAELRQLGMSGSSNDCTFKSFSPLLLSVYLDKPELVKILYADSPLSSYSDSQGRTALMLACELGLEGCIRALLACGASLLDKDTFGGDTAIHYACRAGVPASVIKALLLAQSKNRTSLLKTLSCKNDKGQAPLHVACEFGHAHIVEVFLMTCNSSLLAKLLQIRDDKKQTPLLTAVRAESADIVMSLLMWRSNDQGGKVNKESSDLLDGDSCPLSCAGSTASVDMVLLLLEFMDPNAQETGPNLNLALECAVRSTAETRLDCIRVLVEAGANPCATYSNELNFPSSTALSISCTKGDVQGLTAMLDSWESHLSTKRIARRQDPKLRRQPESYFAAIEAKENVELRDAMTGALVLLLFLGFSDQDLPSSRLDAASSLLHRGARLKDSDFAVLKSSIGSGRLVSSTEASVNDGSNTWYATCYRHPISDGYEKPKPLDGYDRSPLDFWSQRLLSMPWMQSIEEAKCAWMVVQGSARQVDDAARKEHPRDQQVVLVAEGERFVVDASLVSRKSAKLAAAIRFAAMDENGSDCPLEIRLGMSAHFCKWLLQHVYHGSIVSGWNSDPLQCALDLMELAFIAEEFLCPSLLRECEMRLLANDPLQCYCWSCCFSVRHATATDGSDSCGECMYRVQGPSALLSSESVLSALAVSDDMGRLNAMTGSCIKSLPLGSSSNQGGKYASKKCWDVFDDSNQSSNAPPFAHAKDAAVRNCLCNFVAVTKSEAFLSQAGSFRNGNGSPHESNPTLLARQAELVLLRACLDELEASPEPRHGEYSCQEEEIHDAMVQEASDDSPK